MYKSDPNAAKVGGSKKNPKVLWTSYLEAAKRQLLSLDSVAYEWGSGKGGVVRFTYPTDKRPDTNSDLLTLGFITPSIDAVLVRIDGHHDSDHDFIQLEIVRPLLLFFRLLATLQCLFLSIQRAGKVYINYNLGSKDITVGDIATKVNDGKYHVVRFSRSGANSTLQIDDNEPQERFPLGEDWFMIRY